MFRKVPTVNQLPQSNDDLAGVVHQLISETMGSIMSGELRQVRRGLAKAKRMAEASGRADLIGWVQKTAGDLACDDDELELALKYYTRALEQFEQINEVKGQAATHEALGDLDMVEDNHKSAFEHYFRCLELAEQVKDLDLIAESRLKLGEIATEHGSQGSALVHLTKALEAAQPGGDDTMLGYIRVSLGFLAKERGDLVLAMEHLAEAVVHYDHAQEVAAQGRVHLVLGELEEMRGDLGKAYEQRHRGLELIEQDADLAELTMTHLEMASRALERDEHDHAAQHYIRVLELVEDSHSDDPFEGALIGAWLGEAHYGLGQVGLLQDDLDSANQHLTCAEGYIDHGIVPETMVRIYLALSELAEAKGDLEGATVASDKARHVMTQVIGV